MKNNTIKWMTLVIVCTMAGCKKDTEESSTVSQTENYSSVTDFYEKNAVPLQTYTINGSTGGSFTTPQGTTVTIPPNAFTTASGQPVTSNVKVEFKDIYKKSDMLLSNKPTVTIYGQPLKSGGECFIRVLQNDDAVLLAPGKVISVEMPFAAGNAEKDTSMKAYVGEVDTTSIGLAGNNSNQVPWNNSNSNNVYTDAMYYVYNIYNFSTPPVSGTWINCDSPFLFLQSNPTIDLTVLQMGNAADYQTKVYLNFKSVNVMTNIVLNSPYHYAPMNMQCTVIAFGVKDGQLYSAFLPVNIGTTAQTEYFTLTKTTTEEFKNHLNTLN